MLVAQRRIVAGLTPGRSRADVASISVNQVSKAYPNGQMAVRDLTLEIADGELMVLVGPSGSGKSTVLRLIAGLEAPTSGQILIGGRDVTRVPPQDRDLAMVFQSYALYPHKSVRENLAFGLRMRGGRPGAHRGAGARDGACRSASRRCSTASRRSCRAASASASPSAAPSRASHRRFCWTSRCRISIRILRVNTRTELALLHRRLATTMVYVTHDQEEAMTLGTRVAVMRDGAIEQVGAPMVFSAGRRTCSWPDSSARRP